MIDVKDRTGSAVWVSALLIADFLPGGRDRPAARPARRPALAEAAARRRRRRRGCACSSCSRSRSAPGRSSRSRCRGDRLRLRPAGCVRRPPEPRLRGDAPARELAAAHRRPADDHGRHAARRRGRRRLRAGSRVLAERRQLRALGRVLVVQISARAPPAGRRRESHGHWARRRRGLPRDRPLAAADDGARLLEPRHVDDRARERGRGLPRDRLVRRRRRSATG